jgi:hypothetical protein
MPVIVEQRVLQRAVAAAAPIDNTALKFYCRRRLVQPEEQHRAQLGSCSLSACCRTPQKHSELLILKGLAPQVAAAANEVGVEIEVVAVAVKLLLVKLKMLLVLLLEKSKLLVLLVESKLKLLLLLLLLLVEVRVEVFVAVTNEVDADGVALAGKV